MTDHPGWFELVVAHDHNPDYPGLHTHEGGALPHAHYPPASDTQALRDWFADRVARSDLGDALAQVAAIYSEQVAIELGEHYAGLGDER